MSDQNKYKADEYTIEQARTSVSKIQTGYVNMTLDDLKNQHCTPFEVRREFWEILAEWNGFTIVWDDSEKGEG